MPTEKVTQAQTEKIIEKITEIIAEQIKEITSEIIIEKNIEQSNDKNTEIPTIKLAEAISQMISDKLRETSIEQKTEKDDEITQLGKATQLKDKIPATIIHDKNIESFIIDDNVKQTEIKEDYICSNEDVLNNKCGNVTIEIAQIKELFNELSSDLKSYDYTNGEMKFIQTENIIFQITTLDSQELGTNQNVSSVDIGECKKILINIYNISESNSLSYFF